MSTLLLGKVLDVAAETVPEASHRGEGDASGAGQRSWSCVVRAMLAEPPSDRAVPWATVVAVIGARPLSAPPAGSQATTIAPALCTPAFRVVKGTACPASKSVFLGR